MNNINNPTMLLRLVWKFGLLLSGEPCVTEELLMRSYLNALRRDIVMYRRDLPVAAHLRIVYETWSCEFASMTRAKNYTAKIFTSLRGITTCDGKSRGEIAEIVKLVAGLPQFDRLCLLLVEVFSLTFKEVSVVLDVPARDVVCAIVRSRQHIAHERRATISCADFARLPGQI